MNRFSRLLTTHLLCDNLTTCGSVARGSGKCNDTDPDLSVVEVLWVTHE